MKEVLGTEGQNQETTQSCVKTTHLLLAFTSQNLLIGVYFMIIQEKRKLLRINFQYFHMLLQQTTLVFPETLTCIL